MVEVIKPQKKPPLSLFMKLASYLFSFETFFVLFLLSGRFKADPRLTRLPIDLTLLFWVLSITAAFFLFITGKVKIKGHAFAGIVLYLLFSVWIGLTLIWAPPTAYAVGKVVRILTVVLWAYAGAALIVANRPERVARFYYLLVLSAVWLAVESWVVYLSSGAPAPHLERVLGSNYLGIGRVVGLGLSILLAVVLTHGFKKTVIASLTVLAVFFSLTLLILGSRGPFLAALLSFLVALFLSRKSLKFLPLLIAAIAISIPLVSKYVPLTTFYRLHVLIEEPGGGTSASGRLQRMEDALKQIAEAPILGQGVGSFYYYYGDSSLARDYPHNILLELTAETGFVGIFLFAMLISLSLWRIPRRRLSRAPLHFAATLMLVNTFFNAMISGDISDNRLLFTVMGLIAGLSHIDVRSSEVENV